MRWWTILAGTALPAVAGCVQDAAFRGPMPVRNQHPAQLLVQRLPAAGASVLPAGDSIWQTGVAYSSLFLNGSGNGNTLVLDGEYLRGDLAARVGLGGGFELGAELPFAHTSGGFLDHFIIDYHDFFGFPDQDRSEAPRDRWFVEATRQGQSAFQVGSEPLQLLDIPVTLTWNVLPAGTDRLGVALRAGIELPTGDQDRGFSNGGFDYSVGAVGEYRLPWLALFGQLQHTFAATPEPSRAAGLHFEDVTAVECGAELPLLPGLAAVVQLQWETSTLRQLEFPRAGKDQLLVWTGGRLDLSPQWSTEFSIGEDLAGFVSPDFSLWCSLTFRPGAGR